MPEGKEATEHNLVYMPQWLDKANSINSRIFCALGSTRDKKLQVYSINGLTGLDLVRELRNAANDIEKSTLKRGQ